MQAQGNGHTETPGAPVSFEERELVQRELEAIVSSYHFKGSKRYPALLKYVVEAALDKRAGDLKERTLGVEVFGRDPDYDTNADPVVRISAGEVRKRLAQFYHENGQHSNVQIELPLGSYVPEFLMRSAEAILPRADAGPSTMAEKPARPHRRLLRGILAGLAAALLAGAAIAMYVYRQAPDKGEDATLKLWGPLFNSPRPVLIVLGTTHPSNMQPPSQETTFREHLDNPYHHVSVSIAKALAHLSGVLDGHKKAYEVKESPETTLTDIRSRPIILIGALNNDWTLRLTAPLRFHFTFAPDGTQSIDDATNPRSTGWEVDSSRPYLSITTDYAIVARYFDPTTECPVMVVAGIGPYGTEAAGEFLQSPEHLAELAARMPRGWENKNIEVVIKTNVIGTNAGPPVLLSAVTW